MGPRSALASTLWLALSLAGGCAEAPDSVAQRRSAVFGGASDDAHPAVVALLDGPLTGPHHVCSATLVAPRVAVTAAHCLLDDGARYHVQLGGTVAAPTRAIDVVAFARYPEFRGPGDDQRAGLDVAVVVLAADSGVAPIALPADDDGLVAGASVTLVGFGQTDPRNLESAGARDSVTTTLDTLCDRLLASGDATHGFCGGDSGGAVLARGADGVERLVGAIAFGLQPFCAPPGWATRVAPYRRWIQSFIDGAGDASCASTCPPTATCSATQRDAGASGPDADAAAGAPVDAGAGPSGASGGCASGRHAAGAPGAPGARGAIELVALTAIVALSTSRRRRRGGAPRPPVAAP